MVHIMSFVNQKISIFSFYLTKTLDEAILMGTYGIHLKQ